MTRIHRVAQITLIVASLAAPAVAGQQTSAVTQADIQRLQDNIYLADRDINSLRSRDAGLANQLSTQLDDLRDEVIYLKVKLRKSEALPRSEYSDVRDRIEQVRSRAQGTSTAGPAPGAGAMLPPASAGASTSSAAAGAPVPAPAPPVRANGSRGGLEIPTNTEFDVRLSNPLDSGTAKVEDRFEATTIMDLVIDGRTAIPAGSVVRGVVTSVDPATRTNRTAKMTVSFDQVTINGRAYPMRGTVTKAIQGEGIRGEAGRAGAGAAVGGILGAVLGGAKGAILGAVIGGGGTIAATEGKQVELPQGATLTVRFDSPLTVPSTNR